MILSKLTSKGQATIPVEIRNALHLKPGDRITFVIQNNKAMIAKVEPLDYLYHAAVSSSLSEWDSPEDDEAYRDL